MTSTRTTATRSGIAPGEDRLTVEVVEAVAAARGVDALSLEPRLYEAVDPDALERLFESLADGTPRTGGRLVLEIADCEVVVEAGGDVTVTCSRAADDHGEAHRSLDS